MNFRRLKSHIMASFVFSLGATLVISLLQDKFSLENFGLLFGVATVLSLGFSAGAFFSPRQSTNE